MKLERVCRFQPGFLYLPPAFDLALLLGLFILLSTSFLLQPGIAVDVPRSPFILAPQRNPQIISITGAPAPAIYFENEKVSISELEGRFALESGPGTLVIKADRTVPYDLILRVTNLALELGIPVVLATDQDD